MITARNSHKKSTYAKNLGKFCYPIVTNNHKIQHSFNGIFSETTIPANAERTRVTVPDIQSTVAHTQNETPNAINSQQSSLNVDCTCHICAITAR